MGYAFIVLLFAALTYYFVLRTQIKSICEVYYDVPDEYAIKLAPTMPGSSFSGFMMCRKM